MNQRRDMWIKAVGEVIPADRMRIDEPMAKHTTFRVGGPADILVMPESEKEIQAVIRKCREAQIPWMVMGNGSNLLVRDGGIEGVVIELGQHFSTITVKGECITAKAGAMLSAVAKRALTYSLTGLEFAAGIPGTLGGAAAMNAGAYGGAMEQVVKSVTMLGQSGEMMTLPGAQMNYGYRQSIVLDQGYIVLETTIQLQAGDREAIAEKMNDLAKQRRDKQPVELPCAGSVFKRPPGDFAGRLIEKNNLKGYRIGGACVSEKHAGFIVNGAGGCAKDVEDLICHVQSQVHSADGVMLETEIRILGREGNA